MLVSDFRVYKNKNEDIYDFPIKDKKGKIIGWEYTYKKNKGIRSGFVNKDREKSKLFL